MAISSKRERGIGGSQVVFLILLVAGFASAVVTPALAGMKGTYLYDLSNFTGPILYSAPRVSVDKDRNEVSVLFQNTVRVFNENGMEIYRFADDLDLGYIVDVTADREGDILLLAYSPPPESTYKILRCDFRGKPKNPVKLRNLPSEFADFSPDHMVYRNGRLYLASGSQFKVVVTDAEGMFIEGRDLFPLLGLQEKERTNLEIAGFSVADDGSILFTIPVLFTAYRLYPDGKLASFGKPGGAPGRFNIAGGIALDSKGNYIVVDKLKCTVMVFDKDYNYQTQFGFRGYKRGNLIAPDDVAIDKGDRIYVTQNGRRGVSVYRISHE